MDINAAVAEMSALVEANQDKEFVSDHDVSRMMELWGAINDFLANGGFLPKAWE